VVDLGHKVIVVPCSALHELSCLLLCQSLILFSPEVFFLEPLESILHDPILCFHLLHTMMILKHLEPILMDPPLAPQGRQRDSIQLGEL
jgi:hypothetical protein